MGPAFASTLKLLEWHRVCEHVADFASTHAGRRSCLSLGVPPTQQESEALLQLTRCAAANARRRCSAPRHTTHAPDRRRVWPRKHVHAPTEAVWPRGPWLHPA